jgi:hypothetical protein
MYLNLLGFEAKKRIIPSSLLRSILRPASPPSLLLLLRPRVWLADELNPPTPNLAVYLSSHLIPFSKVSILHLVELASQKLPSQARIRFHPQIS